ncbi:MAG: flagellar motor switch protein FliM [Planctomycetota bacterium]|jgi:flagellar motor switch protein FliM|nr:flagellar motor switch protein FliM [Planctomycetota bacterium]
MATDTLSQDDVNALLNNIDAIAGGGETAAPPAAVAAPSKARPAVDYVIYDFKRPERVSTDQIRSMEMLHDVLARKLGAALSSYLRTIVDVKMVSVEQLTYQEFIMSLPNPTCFNLISCEPLDGQMVLEFNPTIVYPILDKLLGGGTNEVHIPEREMSDIEWRLIGRILTDTLTFLREAWMPIMNIDFRVTAHEANPQLMQIVPPNEVVILVCFEIKMNECSGMLNICVPFPVVEPVMSNFSTIQTWFGGRRSNDPEIERRKLNEGVHKVKVEVIPYVAKTNISMHQFLSLKPGDIITTKKRIADDLLLTIDGKPKYMGKAGTFGKYRAFQIKRQAGPADQI